MAGGFIPPTPPKRPAKDRRDVVRAYNDLNAAIHRMDEAAVNGASVSQLYELLCQMHVCSTNLGRVLAGIMEKEAS